MIDNGILLKIATYKAIIFPCRPQINKIQKHLLLFATNQPNSNPAPTILSDLEWNIVAILVP